MNRTVMGGITAEGRELHEAKAMLNCEKICLLGNAAVMAEDQRGRKMEQRLKIQCAGAQARL